VLDRLNALLEPNGCLSLSERGVINGAVPTVVPHPEFRYDSVVASQLLNSGCIFMVKFRAACKKPANVPLISVG